MIAILPAAGAGMARVRHDGRSRRGGPLTGRRARQGEIDPDPLRSQAPVVVGPRRRGQARQRCWHGLFPIHRQGGCSVEIAQGRVNGHWCYDIVYIGQLYICPGTAYDHYD